MKIRGTASIQVPWRHGVQAAVEHVNAEGGINGREIELISEDDRLDTATGFAGYKKLVSQTPTVAIMGATSSDTQAAILPFVSCNEMPFIGAQATIKEAVVPPNDYFFALSLATPNQVDVMLAYAKERAGMEDPKIAVIHNGSAGGVEVAELVKDRTDVVAEIARLSDATAGDPFVQELIKADPDVVLFHGSAVAANIINEGQQKFETQFPMVGVAPSGGPGAFDGLPPSAGTSSSTCSSRRRRRRRKSLHA